MDSHNLVAQAKPALDVVSAAVVVAALASWLPPLAALLTIVWTLLRIWETRTVRLLVSRFRGKH